MVNTFASQEVPCSNLLVCGPSLRSSPCDSVGFFWLSKHTLVGSVGSDFKLAVGCPSERVRWSVSLC